MYVALILVLLGLLIALLVWGRIDRHWISVLIMILLLISRAVDFDEALRYIDWDVLGLILGVSFLTMYLERSGLATLVAKRIIKSFGNSIRLLIFSISLVAGLVSILMENVSVVILLYPVVYSISITLALNPVVPMIMLTLSANIAGSATMIGDPPAILTAGAFRLSFIDFIIYKGKPSMFFFTIISMVSAIAVTSYIYSNKIGIRPSSDYDRDIPVPSSDKVFLVEATAFLVVKIILLSFRHVLNIPLSLTAAVAVGGITIMRILHRDIDSVVYAFKHGFEWKLLVFLVGVFVLSGAFEKHGVASIFAESLVYSMRGNTIALVSALIWLSVAFSAVIDNVPYTLTMIPVVKKVSEMLSLDPVVIMWAVLIGTTLGGNLTYIGASANVTAVRLLEKHGHNVSFTEFVKIGLVYNTTSVLLAWALYILIYFKPGT